MTNFEIIECLLKSDLTDISVLTDLLAMAKEIASEDRDYSKKLARKVKNLAKKQASITSDPKAFELYNNGLLFLAQEHMDFDSYMLYVEKNRDPEDRYYLPRRNKIYHIVKQMQCLIDDKLDILSVSMPPGSGKALDLSALVLTPSGFTEMRNIKVGSKVIGGSGKVSTVLGVYPQGVKPIYELTLNDGSKCRCSDEHIWHVQTRDDRRRGNKYRDVELKDMLHNVKVENGKRCNYSIDYVPKIDCFELKELKLDPYFMGVLLGDGCMRENNPKITIPDTEIKEKIVNLLPQGYTLRYNGRYEYAITGHEKNRRSIIADALRDYGLYGKKSIDKFIPKDYLYASYEQRLWLLRGLLDTDGYAYDSGIEYSTSSEQLAKDVVELVHSLGGYASSVKRKSGYKKDGTYIPCHDSWRVTIQFSADADNPFYLPRKAEGYKPKRKIWKRYITDIKYVGDEECQCIYIDDKTHLYITDDYILTHNTTLGEFFISFVMGHYPNTPNLMSSHSGFMTRMFYDAVSNIILSNEYCWADVFPDVKFESTNAKEETINLDKWQPFKTLTCRPIRASLTGVTRCEGFLYCDDLVSGIEEAMSIDRLDKLYGEYTTDLKSRKKNKAKEIHIATRWSVHDVIGRLERQYEGTGRAMFIAVPDIDPITGESNFDYDYGVGFDVAYFKDMEATMDDVSYRCLYKSDPIEREGILYHPDELLRYMNGLPDKEPDSILAVCDTKDTGKDYNFLGVFYQYGELYYLEDLVFKNIDPATLDELNANMLVKHHVQQCQFESNKEGSRTGTKVAELVKAKGGRTNILKHYTTQNKETKIIINSPWVKQHVVFKDPTEYEPKSDYGVMMSFLCSYTQLGKNPHDDAPDLLAMFALFVDSLYGSVAHVGSRSELGI